MFSLARNDTGTGKGDAALRFGPPGGGSTGHVPDPRRTAPAYRQAPIRCVGPQGPVAARTPRQPPGRFAAAVIGNGCHPKAPS